ncbi:MAG: 4-hydroxy-tetrahydrodipicolinate reductase [Planctomycetaceae bacterium]|nr:4-hydroxy-tetrahydrodipicolinate reductase [Planctomycetaceae bacterium]
MTPTRIAIVGAAGRMGQRLVALTAADPLLEVVAAIESAGHPQLGEDSGLVAGIKANGVPITAKLGPNVGVVIDFSSPKGMDALLDSCIAHQTPLVYATTGLSPEQETRLREAARQIPLLWSPSMSMTVILGMRLAQEAAKVLKDKDADVEIVEHHHRYKADAPSGTALKFGQIIAAEMGIDHFLHGREGKIGARPHDEIGYHAVRIGDNPGQHTILFGLLGETLELTIKASNRDAYALGAFAAAKFLFGKPVGLYDMNDVLFQ